MFKKEYIEKLSSDFDYQNTRNMVKKAAFNIFEAKALYALIKYYQFKNILEISPWQGFTTNIMLRAYKNSSILSYDLNPISQKFDCYRRKLIIGDVKETIQDKYIKKADFVFIDSEHTYKFGEWYCKNILKKLKPKTIIWIHDWYSSPIGKKSETCAVYDHFLNTAKGDILLNISHLKEKNPSVILIKNEIA
jgi:predicted O-methyltransferase YrrM